MSENKYKLLYPDGTEVDLKSIQIDSHVKSIICVDIEGVNSELVPKYIEGIATALNSLNYVDFVIIPCFGNIGKIQVIKL